MRVIIAGGRDFNNYPLLCSAVASLKEQGIEIDEIVCGCARGADLLGKRYGEENNIPVKLMPADWDQYGRSAGPIRNHQMGDYADFLLAFWDGKSRGTKDMIEYMKKKGKHGKVVRY